MYDHFGDGRAPGRGTMHTERAYGVNRREYNMAATGVVPSAALKAWWPAG